ncbi:cobalt-precorrin-6A reductase [Methylorubrum extorquens]|uniref:cobalt-precorrin-6A reductase n=1 Tax=Methylorubrum extorquens TaxID=408 RepID=UPI00223731C3|nr:cobalt-precorrin-6A reductase [Methylorubrum extorquens]UYW26122.1 cobalt-precorrin-6A reductase [Methylorubrum extorquens]UYW34074.1 cobalt-precorrin-6A reductase [Methylorubrum extorquens]
MSGAADQGSPARHPTPNPDAAPLRILVLGGTAEASALVALLAREPDVAVTLSLAGRTAAPRPEPVPTRIGGFGGAEGLARWLSENSIEAVIDATHPFAARISANAAEACKAVAVPLLAVRRPAWEREPGDDWIAAANVPACLDALGPAPRTVFLTIGRQELAAFVHAPQHAYIVRTIEPVGDALPVPNLVTVSARGPFTLADEIRFMREARIEVLVTKNSGGAATYPKIEAARRLGLPVVIVDRPALPDVPAIPDAAGALSWLMARRSERRAP